MKRLFLIPMIIAILLLSACGPQAPVCPPATGTPRYLTVPLEAPPTSVPGSDSTPVVMEIGGKTIPVDKLVEGPLCNDTWSGTVYVSCNIQVVAWEEEPLFLKNCNLTIETGTIAYVAYHNNAAYYNGCSYHTGEQPAP